MPLLSDRVCVCSDLADSTTLVQSGLQLTLPPAECSFPLFHVLIKTCVFQSSYSSR